MITQVVKNTAISRLRCCETPEEIAKDMGLPLPLVREWNDNLNPTDLVQLQANVFAVQNFAKAELMDSSSRKEELLRIKIEEVAIEIVEQVALNVIMPDIVRAKTLQLCADTITKLYDCLISKRASAGSTDRPSGQTMTIFQSIMKE